MTLAENLKSATKELHDTAEGHNFQGRLAQALLPLDSYTDYLGQLFLIHSALEAAILAKRESDTRLAKVVLPNQLQEPFLKKDLQYLKADYQKLQALPSTNKFVGQIQDTAEKTPVALLGFHYVLLGSKHGGKFIAKNARQKYKFAESGAIYFDPYGDQFMPCWRAFIQSLNEVLLVDGEIEATIAAAKTTFISIGEIGSELEHRLKDLV